MKMMNVYKLVGLMLFLAMSNAHPMVSVQDKLTNLKESLGNLKGGLEQLASKLRILKNKLGGVTEDKSKSKVDVLGAGTEPTAKEKEAWKIELETTYPKKFDYFEIPQLEGAEKSPFEAFYLSFKKLYLDPKFVGSKITPGNFKVGGTEHQYDYTQKDIDDIKDYIGRAMFERNILDYCKKNIIDVSKKNKEASIADPTWVYNNGGLKDMMDVVVKSAENNIEIADDFLNELLDRTAREIKFAVEDMFYHREKTGSNDELREENQRVRCQCLTNPLRNGYDKRSDYGPHCGGVPKEYTLRNPILYLIFETMHITLFHGIDFTNSLIDLFDYTKLISNADVAVHNKTCFRAGFEGTFQEIMKEVVAEPKIVVNPLSPGGDDGLLILPQRDDNGQILYLDGKPRDIIYGKKTGHDYCYWCQGSYNDAFPDGKPHHATAFYYTCLHENELRYALKKHINRHTCYSVGLIPYELAQVFKLKPEVEIKVTELVKNAVNNKKESDRLDRKIKGLERVAIIVEYLTHKWYEFINRPMNIGTRNQFFSKESILSQNIEKPKDMPEIQRLDKSKKLPETITRNSITQDEWNQVFKNLAVNKELMGCITKYFDDSTAMNYLNQNFKDEFIALTPEEQKAKAPKKSVAQAMLAAFNAGQ